MDKDGKGDPVTLADLTVQKTIEQALAHYFPSLKVCGEESAESMDKVEVALDPSTLEIEFVQEEMLLKSHEARKEFNESMSKFYKDEILSEFESFSTEKAVVWIDPLDGTKDFVKGNLPAVTVLIGLAIDGVPKIGVVHNPFQTNEPTAQGVTVFGT